MQEVDPTTWPRETWLLALGMACGGGIINWLSRLKQGTTRKFNVIELLGEVFTSGFIGVGAFMVIESLGQPIGLCAAGAGLAGHMGTRLLFLIEKTLESRATNLGDKI